MLCCPPYDRSGFIVSVTIYAQVLVVVNTGPPQALWCFLACWHQFSDTWGDLVMVHPGRDFNATLTIEEDQPPSTSRVSQATPTRPVKVLMALLLAARWGNVAGTHEIMLSDSLSCTVNGHVDFFGHQFDIIKLVVMLMVVVGIVGFLVGMMMGVACGCCCRKRDPIDAGQPLLPGFPAMPMRAKATLGTQNSNRSR